MIDIDADWDGALRDVDRTEKQVLYAASRAVNETIKDVQSAIRARVLKEFTIRSDQSKRFLLNSVLITKWSHKKQDPILAQIDVAGSRGFQRARWGLLAKFEAGGRRVMRQDPFQVPTARLRPSFSDAVPRALYPKNLRMLGRFGGGTTHKDFLPAKAGVRKKVLGAKRSFFVLGGPGEKRWGVYERIGKARGDFRMIWSFRASIVLPPLLPFTEIADRVSRINLPVHFKRMFDLAMSTAYTSAGA